MPLLSEDVLEAADDIRTFLMSEDGMAFPGNRERIAAIIERIVTERVTAAREQFAGIADREAASLRNGGAINAARAIARDIRALVLGPKEYP